MCEMNRENVNRKDYSYHILMWNIASKYVYKIYDVENPKMLESMWES